MRNELPSYFVSNGNNKMYLCLFHDETYKTLVLLYDVCWLSNNSDNYDSIILLHALAHLYCA